LKKSKKNRKYWSNTSSYEKRSKTIL